jgi:hypothetical protein
VPMAWLRGFRERRGYAPLSHASTSGNHPLADAAQPQPVRTVSKRAVDPSPKRPSGPPFSGPRQRCSPTSTIDGTAGVARFFLCQSALRANLKQRAGSLFSVLSPRLR